MAKLVTLIETTEKRGEGVSGDPIRPMVQYWTTDGKLVFEKDEWEDSKSKKKPEFGIDFKEELRRRCEEEKLHDPTATELARKKILADQAVTVQHMKTIQVLLSNNKQLQELLAKQKKYHEEACRLSDLCVKACDAAKPKDRNRVYNARWGDTSRASQKAYDYFKQANVLQQELVLEYCNKHQLLAGLFSFLIS